MILKYFDMLTVSVHAFRNGNDLSKDRKLQLKVNETTMSQADMSYLTRRNTDWLTAAVVVSEWFHFGRPELSPTGRQSFHSRRARISSMLFFVLRTSAVSHRLLPHHCFPISHSRKSSEVNKRSHTTVWTTEERRVRWCKMGNSEVMAEREGFEPPNRLPRCRFSKPVHSTALPSLRIESCFLKEQPKFSCLLKTGLCFGERGNLTFQQNDSVVNSRVALRPSVWNKLPGGSRSSQSRPRSKCALLRRSLRRCRISRNQFASNAFSLGDDVASQLLGP